MTNIETTFGLNLKLLMKTPSFQMIDKRQTRPRIPDFFNRASFVRYIFLILVEDDCNTKNNPYGIPGAQGQNVHIHEAVRRSGFNEGEEEWKEESDEQNDCYKWRWAEVRESAHPSSHLSPTPTHTSIDEKKGERFFPSYHFGWAMFILTYWPIYIKNNCGV